MPEEFVSTSPHSSEKQASEKQLETQVILLGSLLFMSLSVCSFTLGGLSRDAYDPTTQALALNSFPLTLVSGAGGAFVGFLACNLLTDRFRIAQNLFSAFLIAAFALVVGFVGTLAHISFAAAFIGFSLAFLYILWVRLSMPVSSHSFFVIALALTIVVPGAFSSFANVTSELDHQNLLLLALVFSLASCFFTFLLYFGTRNALTELPDRTTSSLRSHSVSTTFRPAIIDGFILGLCLRVYGEGAALNFTIGISLGLALILSACLSCLQLIPRSNYEKFVRNHASSFKVIPLLLPVLFGSEFLLITSAISLFTAVSYTMFLMTSLNDRMLLLELSPFYTYGAHGAVFFSCMAAGIIAMPIFSLIHIDAPLWCRIVFLVVLVGMEWLLVGTINRKSYIDPESNRLAAREKVTQNLSVNKSNALNASSTSNEESRETPTQSRNLQPTRQEDVSNNQETSSSESGNERTEQNSMSRWSNHIRMMADMYGLSARQEEVLFLLAKGRTAQFIADKLTITLATSKSHIYNIYIKFGVHSQQELLDLLESEDN